jgi:DNA polymerase-3 subunit delta
MNYIIVSKERSYVSLEIENIIKDLGTSKQSVVNFEYDDSIVNQILDEANTMSLFDEKKIIIVDNILFSKINSELVEYLENPNTTTILILVDYETDIKKIKTIEGCKIINCSLETDKMGFIKECLCDFKIDSNALKYLFQISNDDLNYIKNELDKLMMYKWEEKEITIKDIEEIVSFPNESDAFKLIDYIVQKDSKKALKTYYHILDKEDPIKIITILANQIRLIYQIKVMSNQSNEEIASDLKVHPYRVKLGREKARNYDENSLIDILYSLSEIDISIKSGTIDKTIALENYIIMLRE